MKALRMDCAGVAVRAQLKATSVYDESFFQLGKNNQTSDWGLCSGHQKAVISARIASINGCGSKAADSVGLQPFATEAALQLLANFFRETDHDTVSSMSLLTTGSEMPLAM